MATPAGTLSLAKANLRRMLSLSTTFQAESGGSAALALEQIFYKGAPIDTARPYAVIGTEEYGFGIVAGGDQNQLRPRGRFLVFIARDIASEDFDDPTSAECAWENFFGQIISELADLAGKADDPNESFLAIVEIDVKASSEIHEEGSLSRFYGGLFTVEWGDSSRARF